MWNKLKRKLGSLMSGRYGFDELSKALTVVALIMMLISSFFHSVISLVISFLAWAVFFYAYYRAFSRKIFERSAENRKYLSKVRYMKMRFSQRKTHRFYTCPKCGTLLRVPKGAGKITITCNNCGHQFDRKA